MLMSNRNKAAKLYYMPNGFRPLSSGDHVFCAISGEKIALEELRYWSVNKQEPYATAEISARAHLSGDEQ
ncbi:Exodeoxyribonuclease VII small subunit [hydrothermal vent metagenome]|uniref:Exodeoxyribonuclease VII small subunit n=1 Tax=hydrothermal vent metagenome TaxID=652676 RepID=A0A3B0R8P4_9ZZZZ